MAIVKSVMKSRVTLCAPNDTVRAAAKKMAETGVGAILVADGDHLTGIFTERDVLNKVVAGGLDPDETLVKDVCSANPVTVRPGTHIKDCAQILKEKGFRHLPVTEGGKPVGIVSSRDFFLHVTEQLESVIDKVRMNETKVPENFDIYELVGGGGYGIPPER